MTTIEVKASRTYRVEIGRGLLDTVGEKTAALLKGHTAAVISDTNVAPLYLEKVRAALEGAGLDTVSFVFPAGESSKNGETYLNLLEFLAGNHLTRADGLLALGGGVVGDLTGFAAATYLRGLPFLQLPTTLLAAVDASVGGKTAIDLKAGKNLAGAFYQPGLVLCDVNCLDTLSKEVFSDGCAEVIKYGMLKDKELLRLLERIDLRQDPEEVISRCVTMKRDVVAEDEFDTGQRQLLNLGHTVGHGVEACSGYTVSHGKAVAIGMAIVTRAAVKKGLCPPEALEILLRLLRRFGLPERTDFSAQQLYEKTLSDKKRAGDQVTLVVPSAVGRSVLLPLPVSHLRDWIEKGLSE